MAPNRNNHNKVFTIPQKDQDAGWAWIVLFGSFAASMNVGATTTSNGILYVEFLERYGESPSKTALVSSVNYFTYSISACLSGYLSDKIPMALPIIIASIVGALGTVYAGFSPSLLGVILTLGALHGSCRGFFQAPALGSLGRYFSSKRTFASSVAVSGGSIGLILIPLVLRVVLDWYSIPGATAILGGVILHGCILGTALRPLIPVTVEQSVESELKDIELSSLDEQQEPLKINQPNLEVTMSKQTTSPCSRFLSEVAFLANPLLLRTLAAIFFCGMLYINWSIFLPAYVNEIGLSKTDASIFLSLTGISVLVTRPIGGYIITRTGINKTVVLLVCCCVASLACMAFAFLPMIIGYDLVPTFWSLVLLSVIIAITGNYFPSLMMPLVVDAVDVKDLGRAVGMLPMVTGCGVAVGTQVFSAIQEASGSFQTVQWCIGLGYIPAIMLLTWNIVSHRKTVRKSLNS